jgi:hypothetical protein
MAQLHPLPSGNLVNSSADLGLNKQAAELNSEFNYTIPSVVQPGPPSRSFSVLNNPTSHQYQLSDALQINDININTDPSLDFIFNVNDLPIIEETPSNEISQSFSESASLGPTPSLDTQQFDSDVYGDFNTDSFLGSFDDTIVGSNADPGSSNIAQSFSEIEEMYTNPSWFESQDAQPSSSVTVANQY